MGALQALTEKVTNLEEKMTKQTEKINDSKDKISVKNQNEKKDIKVKINFYILINLGKIVNFIGFSNFRIAFYYINI